MSELLDYLIQVRGGRESAAQVGAVKKEFVGLGEATTRANVAQDVSALRSDKAAKGFSGMEKSASALRGTLGLVAGAIGLGALKLGVDDVVKAGTSWQDQQAQMQAALKSTHQASREHSRSLADTAEKLSTSGGFTEPENIQALTRLLTATGSVTKSTRDLGLATDIARRFHLPFLSSVRAVAMAESGRTTGLTRLGVAVKKGMTGQQALAELQNKTSGSTAAFAHTAAGAMSDAAHAMDNAARAMSVGLLPVIAKLGTWLANHIPAAIHTAIAAVKSVVAWFEKNKGVAIALGVGLGILAADWLALQIATTAASVAMGIFNAIIALNPFAKVILAVALLTAGVIYAYHHCTTFRHILQAIGRAGAAAFSWVVTAVQDAAHWISHAADTIHHKWNGLISFFKGVPKSILGFFTGLGSGITGIFNGIANFIIGILNTLIRSLDAIHIKLPSVLGIGGGTIGFNIGQIATVGGGSGAAAPARGGATHAHSQLPGHTGGNTPRGVVTAGAAYNGGDIHIHIGGQHFGKVTRREIQKAMMGS